MVDWQICLFFTLQIWLSWLLQTKFAPFQTSNSHYSDCWSCAGLGVKQLKTKNCWQTLLWMVEFFPTPVKTSHWTLPAFPISGQASTVWETVEGWRWNKRSLCQNLPHTFARFLFSTSGWFCLPDSLLSYFQAGVRKVRSTFLILNKVSEWFAAGWVAEFAEGFGFNLADAFTGYVKNLTNIF